MKGAYICSANAERLEGNAGVFRKIKAQAVTLGELTGSCSVVFYEPPVSKISKTIARLPFTGGGNVFPNPTSLDDCDYVYIRKPHITSEFIKYLKAQRESCGDRLLILLELPTYPYDKEMSEFKNISLLAKDRAGRKKLVGLVDRIVTFSDDDEIFGVPTIKSFNGVDLHSVELRKCNWEPTKDNPLEILCCARFSKWHGIDRLIEGLHNYYAEGGNRDIRIHMLGVGPELPMLESMVRDGKLEDKVCFHGFKQQSMMDEFYDKCSFAVGSLGVHRLGLTCTSTLKSREYLAKGIPFIYAGDIDVLKKTDFPYAKQVPSDDSPINIDELIEFHDGLYAHATQAEIAKRMRDFAIANVSMEQAMSPVADFITAFEEK
jgi:hypothetical protein